MVKISYITEMHDISVIREAIEFHDKTRGSYFWKGNKQQANKLNEIAVNELITIIEQKIYKNGSSKQIPIEIEIRQNARSSCSNFYVRSNVYIDGIKSSFKRLKNIYEKLE